jgi:dipeptidyl aminopeptidase/acylaminoacyl peptidase
MRRTTLIAASILVLWLGPSIVAEPPRGSITIERIAEIKYPTSPAWSPDGQRVAFIWDAAGKQDVFAVTPGGAAQALTRFPVDPHLLTSDIGALAWMSDDAVLFGRDGRLWSASVSGGEPRVVEGLADAASFALSPDRRQIAFLRQGDIWIGSVAAKTQRRLTQLAAPLGASVPSFSPDGRWLAFTASHTRLEPEDLPWNGSLVRSMATITTDRRLGIVSAQGGDVFWVPTVGNVTGVQWTSRGAIVYQE